MTTRFLTINSQIFPKFTVMQIPKKNSVSAQFSLDSTLAIWVSACLRSSSAPRFYSQAITGETLGLATCAMSAECARVSAATAAASLCDRH